MAALANYIQTPNANLILNPDTGFHIKHANNITYVHNAAGSQMFSFTDTGAAWFSAAKALAAVVA
jgi:hypothetical protein